MIEQIVARNVKGRDFSHTLEKLNIITGPNFAGKTAILDAVRIGILGYLPELGKTNKATFQLAGGDSTEMSVNLTMSDKVSFYRNFTISNGSIKSTGTDPIEMPLLTPEAYFAMTDKTRREYVAARFGSGLDLTVEDIIAEMEKHSFEKDHSAEVETEKAKVIGDIKDVLEGKGDLTELISEAIVDLKANYAVANGKSKDSAGAVRTLTELKAKEQNFDKVDVLKAQIEAAERSLSEAVGRCGELSGKRDGAKASKDRAEKLRGLLAEPVQDFDHDIKARLLIRPETVELAPMKEAIDKLTASIGAYEVSLEENNRALKQVLDAGDAAKAKINEISELHNCPYCKSKTKGWDKNLKDQYSNDVLKSAESGQNFIGAIREIEKELSGLRSDLDEAKKQWGVAIAGNTLRNDIDHEISCMKIQKEKGETSRKEWQEELYGIKEFDVPSDEVIEATKGKADLLREEVYALKERFTAAIGIQNDIKRAAESAQAHVVHEATKTVIKAFGKQLTVLQEKAVSGVFVEMLKIANGIAEGLLLSPIAYHDGEIGRWDGGRFISHATFSGTEKTITYSAIAAALSSKSKYKIMLIDELSRMTPTTIAKLIERLEEQVSSGNLDQIIMVEPSEWTSRHEGWNNIHVGEKMS